MPFAMYARCGFSEYRVLSWEQVSRAYRATIERLGLGPHQAPNCTIHNDHGAVVGWVDYYGCVWSGDMRRKLPVLIYSPETQAAA